MDQRPLSLFACRTTSAFCFTFLKSQTVHCGFGFSNFHRLYDSDGFVNQAVAEFRHTSVFRLYGTCVFDVFFLRVLTCCC